MWGCFSINSVQAMDTFANAPGRKSLISFEGQQERHAAVWHFYLR